MANKTDTKIFELTRVDIVLDFNSKPMPTLLDDSFSHPLICFRNQYMAVRVPKFEIHPNILHIKRRSLKPMHEHNKPILSSIDRFTQYLHILTRKPYFGNMLLHTAKLQLLAFLFEHLLYLLVVVACQNNPIQPVVLL